MSTIAKAIVGALIAALSALGAALTDGQVTATEWVVVATALLTGLGLVWAVPNAPVKQ